MAKVQFKRIENSSNINSVPVVDGQLIYTKDGKQYMDYDTTRVNIASGGGGSGTSGVTRTVLWQGDPTGLIGNGVNQGVYIQLSDSLDNYDGWEIIYSNETHGYPWNIDGSSGMSTGILPITQHGQNFRISTKLKSFEHRLKSNAYNGRTIMNYIRQVYNHSEDFSQLYFGKVYGFLNAYLTTTAGVYDGGYYGDDLGDLEDFQALQPIQVVGYKFS